jgi:anti-sigma-K factor RskA
MSDIARSDGQDPDMLAAEYALGLLEGEERLAAEWRLAADAGFALEAQAWQARFAGLSAALGEELPPLGLWPRIAQRLTREANVVDLRLRRALTLWRGAAGAAAVAAAALLVVAMWPRPLTPAPPPLLSATLASGPEGSGAAVFVAIFDPARRRIVLAPASIAGVPGRSPELWLIPTGGKPISLGVATFDRAVQFKPKVDPAVSGATLAVTIEPLGGSPTGKPTGPVVATGKLTAL